MKKSIFLILIFFLFISSLSGQIPQTISYQGVLTDTSGTPLNGNYNLNFKFYTVPTGGSSIWAESQNVTVADGIFNVILGSINPLNLPFDTVYWLGISVGSSNELGPRIQLTASPYSLLARSVSDSSITAVKIADGAVTGPKLSDSTLQAGSNVTITRQSNGALQIGASGGGVNLPFSGSTSSSNAAFSVENTGSGNGLEVPQAGGQGVLIAAAAVNGVQVNQATFDGIQIQSAGRDGVRVSNASEQGLLVQHAAGDGVYVNQADQDGLYVGNAGQYGLEVVQATQHGVKIGQANDGVNIGTANGAGMVIGSAQRGVDIINTSSDGILVRNAGQYGLEVSQATDHGIHIGQANDGVNIGTANGAGMTIGSAQRGVNILNTSEDGILVQSASRYGLNVVNAARGVDISNTTSDGILVRNAGHHGLFVQDAVSNGLEIDHAGNDGMLVQSADRYGLNVVNAVRGVDISNTTSDGILVRNAGRHGLLVQDAASNGVEIDQTTFDGVQIQSAGRDGIRISGAAEYGILASGTTGAALFNGDVTVTGTLTKGGGSFKIDHPLDPANKYLEHSFVESPDMMNVYNGNATLNAAGEAIVSLPDYFISLNRDFRYQLTAIGKPGPNLYIADKITNNHFKIAGGQPGMEVSWQVTGVRQDPWADANRIKVEEQKKPEERGYFLNPKLYGQPESRNIVNVVHVNESKDNALSQK